MHVQGFFSNKGTDCLFFPKVIRRANPRQRLVVGKRENIINIRISNPGKIPKIIPLFPNNNPVFSFKPISKFTSLDN